MSAAGPAGIFASLELTQTNRPESPAYRKRQRYYPVAAARYGKTAVRAASCKPCNVVCGLGGAGAFSDGKLVISTQVGGHLGEYLGEEHAAGLIEHVDNVYVKFGATRKVFGGDGIVEEMSKKAAAANLRLVPTPVRHMGTDNGYQVLKNMQDYLFPRMDVKTKTMVSKVIVENGEVKGVETSGGEKFFCKYLVLAPGREGADWFAHEAEPLEIDHA